MPSSAKSRTSILLTGPTGYIGGTILQRLLDHEDRATFDITVLVRDYLKAEKLHQFGITPVIGSLQDTEKLAQLASQADIVIHAANADDLPAVKAILSGLKEKHEQSGGAGILIHTSGTGFLVNLEGDTNIDPDIVYYDSKSEQLESLPVSRIHREVDLAIVAADTAGYVRAYIVCPSTIFNMASGPLVDSGIQNPHSVLIPWMIKNGIQRGQGGLLESGTNVWPLVDIDEVGDLYKLIFDAARADPLTPHGRAGYYFAENGEYVQYEICLEIAKALFEHGKGRSPEPVRLTDQEFKNFFGGSRLGALNCRARGERSRALGWRPKKGKAELLASVEPEIQVILAWP